MSDSVEFEAIRGIWVVVDRARFFQLGEESEQERIRFVLTAAKIHTDELYVSIERWMHKVQRCSPILMMEPLDPERIPMVMSRIESDVPDEGKLITECDEFLVRPCETGIGLEAILVIGVAQAGAEQSDSFRREVDPVQLPFRMPIQDKFRIGARGLVVAGTIERGRLKPGDKLHLIGQRGAMEVTAESLEMFRKLFDDAIVGDNVGVLIGDVEENCVQPGDLLCAMDEIFHRCDPETVH